jgi:hypothetical protein
MSAGTFPIDLPTNRFKGYGLYPHSITEEERKAIIEQEKEIMRKACKALLEIRLQVLEKDCLHLDKEVLEPLKKYEETLKDASIPFPIIKEHNHPLQKYIIDAILNGLLNPPAYSRSGTPRSRTSSISRRRTPPLTAAPAAQNPPVPLPPQSTIATIPATNSITPNNLHQYLERLGLVVIEDPRLVGNNTGANHPSNQNNLNWSGRGGGNGNHEGQRQRRPFNSRHQPLSNISYNQRLSDNRRNASPSPFPSFNNNNINNFYRRNNNNYHRSNNNYQPNNFHNNNNNFHNNYDDNNNNEENYNSSQYHQQGRGRGRGNYQHHGRGNQGRENLDQFQNNQGSFSLFNNRN